MVHAYEPLTRPGMILQATVMVLSLNPNFATRCFFFPKAEQKFEEAVEKAKDAQAMFAEYLGRQKKGLGKVMTHMLHIL